LMNS